MESSLDFARNQFEVMDGNNTKERKWNELTSHLNSLGGAEKTADQWKKYWVDFQSNAKERIAAHQNRQNESGVNGTKKLKALCDLDVRVAAIMNLAAIDGDQSTQEGGLDLPTVAISLPTPQAILPEQDLTEPIPSTSGATPQPTRKRKTPLRSVDKLRSSQSVRAALANVSILYVLLFYNFIIIYYFRII